MQGVSRSAQAQVREATQRVLDAGVDWAALSDDLFSVVAVLDGSAALRRAVGDPSREGSAKSELVGRVFGGRVSDATVDVVKAAAAQRWSSESDLVTALETAAVDVQFAMAEAAGRGDDVEEQLFRFERAVAGAGDLRDGLNDARLPRERKESVVDALTQGRVHPETRRLLLQAVRHPRGRRFDSTIEHYLAVGEQRRDRLAALVSVAQPLTGEQQHRLVAALERLYERKVDLRVVIVPEVIGGIRIQVGDEVVDGTVVRRLEQARRAMDA